MGPTRVSSTGCAAICKSSVRAPVGIHRRRRSGRIRRTEVVLALHHVRNAQVVAFEWLGDLIRGCGHESIGAISARGKRHALGALEEAVLVQGRAIRRAAPRMHGLAVCGRPFHVLVRGVEVSVHHQDSQVALALVISRGGGHLIGRPAPCLWKVISAHWRGWRRWLAALVALAGHKVLDKDGVVSISVDARGVARERLVNAFARRGHKCVQPIRAHGKSHLRRACEEARLFHQSAV